MAQSLSRIILHLVFGTKGGANLIPESVQPKLHAYLAGGCRALGSEALRVGGVDNHVHVACTLPRTLTASQLVREIKRASSGWMKEGVSSCPSFAWQSGYGAFSVGQSQLDTLLRYIDNQRSHHRRWSFKEEFAHLLDKYGVEYDQRYLWE